MATSVIENLMVDFRDSGNRTLALFQELSASFSKKKITHVDRLAFGFTLRQLISQVDAAIEFWSDLLGDLKSHPVRKDIVKCWIEGLTTSVDNLAKASTIANSIVASHADFDQTMSGYPGLLERIKEKLSTMGQEINWWVAALNQPMPPVDEARLAAGLEASSAGRIINADDFVSQLRLKNQR